MKKNGEKKESKRLVFVCKGLLEFLFDIFFSEKIKPTGGANDFLWFDLSNVGGVLSSLFGGSAFFLPTTVEHKKESNKKKGQIVGRKKKATLFSFNDSGTEQKMFIDMCTSID